MPSEMLNRPSNCVRALVAIDSLYQFEQAGVETIEFGQQRNRIFGGLLALLHARRARQPLVHLGDTILTVTAFGKCFG